MVEKDTDDAEVLSPAMPKAVQGKRRCASVTPTTCEFIVHVPLNIKLKNK
jgi:hypothetical protein